MLSIIVILVVIGFNATAGLVDIRTRLKYSNICSGAVSSRMDTITVVVVEEGLNVRSKDILRKSIPAAFRDRPHIAIFAIELHTSLFMQAY